VQQETKTQDVIAGTLEVHGNLLDYEVAPLLHAK